MGHICSRGLVLVSGHLNPDSVSACQRAAVSCTPHSLLSQQRLRTLFPIFPRAMDALCMCPNQSLTVVSPSPPPPSCNGNFWEERMLPWVCHHCRPFPQSLGGEVLSFSEHLSRMFTKKLDYQQGESHLPKCTLGPNIILSISHSNTLNTGLLEIFNSGPCWFLPVKKIALLLA